MARKSAFWWGWILCLAVAWGPSCGPPPGDQEQGVEVLQGQEKHGSDGISEPRMSRESSSEPGTSEPGTSEPGTWEPGSEPLATRDAGASDASPREAPPQERPAGCDDGARRCDGSSGYQLCTAGVWGATQPCGQDEACKLDGLCVSTLPPPDPCKGACWENQAPITACGFYSQQEDFRTGKYNVHQYHAKLRAKVPLELSLQNLEGTWEPALYITLKDGTPLTPRGRGPASIQVQEISSGRKKALAQWRLESATAQEIVVYVTSWAVVDSAFVDVLPKTAKYDLLLQEDCPGTGGGFAPTGAVTGERKVSAGVHSVAASSGFGVAYRVDAGRGQHIGFRLDFKAGSGVVMEVLAWVGGKALSLGQNNWGPNLRTLAAVDTVEKRTFWVRIKGLSQAASLKITRTPFVDGARCTSDCARLLQLPLPMDRKKDGYFTHPNGKYPYQFGRRDLVMALRHAGKILVAAGYPPFPVKDYSKWDGSTPPGHSSHKNGEDVDISVFEKGVGPVWKPMCKTDGDTNCVKGSDFGFDGVGMAVMLQGFLETGRIVYAFLDRQFIPLVIAGAEARIKAGKMPASLLPLYKKAISHWPNHHHHVHVRIEKKPYP